MVTTVRPHVGRAVKLVEEIPAIDGPFQRRDRNALCGVLHGRQHLTVHPAEQEPFEGHRTQRPYREVVSDDEIDAADAPP